MRVDDQFRKSVCLRLAGAPAEAPITAIDTVAVVLAAKLLALIV
jgi:hypothetical protein